MVRLITVDLAEASGKTKKLLEQVRAAMGMTPNMTKVFTNYINIAAQINLDLRRVDLEVGA